MQIQRQGSYNIALLHYDAFYDPSRAINCTFFARILCLQPMSGKLITLCVFDFANETYLILGKRVTNLWGDSRLKRLN